MLRLETEAGAVVVPRPCLAGQRLTPTLADDVATAILVACRLKLAGVYHVANPEVFGRRELAALFLQTMNLKGKVQIVGGHDLQLVEPRPLSAVVDPSRFLAAAAVRFTPMREALLQFRTAAAGREP